MVIKTDFYINIVKHLIAVTLMLPFMRKKKLTPFCQKE